MFAGSSHRREEAEPDFVFVFIAVFCGLDARIFFPLCTVSFVLYFEHEDDECLNEHQGICDYDWWIVD